MNIPNKIGAPNDVIAVIADQKYIGYLKTLLNSLSLSNQKISVYVCLVNINKTSRLEKSLKKRYENIYIEYINRTFNSNADKKGFCVNYRIPLIRKILNHDFKNILFLDADSIVRKSLYEAKVSESSDIEILFRDSEDVRMKVACGVILIKNNIRSKRFIELWEKKNSSGKYTWFYDQITFFETFMEMRKEVNVENIDSNLIDWEFKKSSIIWSGKGNRKSRNLLYIYESLKTNCFRFNPFIPKK